MTNDMEFGKAIKLINSLQDCKKLRFYSLIPMNAKGRNDIKGIAGAVLFGGTRYRFMVYAQKLTQKIKVDINLNITPKREYRTLLLALLMSVNLMADFDYTFVMDKSDRVRILGELDYQQHPLSLCSLEYTFLNLLDAVKIYKTIIRSVSYGHKVPFKAQDKASTEYYVFRNPKYLILPLNTRRNLSEHLCKDCAPLFPRYIRIDEKEQGPDDDSPFP